MQSTHQLVPEFIYEKYRAGAAYGSFQGAAMFVDLSGFSTMTDVLSTHGTHGAEVLANMMGEVFEPLVNAVYQQGGFVIGYAGDAFNAIFPSEQDAEQDSDQAMKRCLSSALVMQEHIRFHSQISTPYGEFTIRIKVGIGFGPTTWQIFKSNNGKHASYWFRGESLNGAVAGEELARAGDVVADSTSYSLLKDIITVSPVGDCYLIMDVVADLPTPHSLPTPKPVDDLVDIFFADEVTRLPIAGEFRQAVNLFIDIPANISDEALIAPFMETVYLLQEQYGGFFLRPDVGDKGFNLLMFWGAPTTYENDVERALNFVLELSLRTRITLRAGISYRMAYAGFIGSSQREDYTAYGWGVNLAARMMERAGAGKYWMDEEVARRAAKHFNFEPLGAQRFKGFKDELKIFSLIGRKNLVEVVYQGQLVGRSKELESLVSFIHPLRQGRFAGVMVLNGEAGIGKSRLVHSFQYSENFNDLSVRWVVCQADEILRLPFNPFIDWLKMRFELLEGQPDEVNSIAFSHNIQELIEATPDPGLAAELNRTSSVLAALINIPQSNSLYESLDAKGRYENTLIALSVLLRAESLQKPLILFIEDTHWLDEDTGEFLSYFIRTLLADTEKQHPIAIIATQRPESDSRRILDEVSTTGIQLGKLTSVNMSQLARDILGHSIADSLLTLLDARADGNPFFAEQILRYLLEKKALMLDADGKYFANEQAEITLPTDVRAVMIARLDRLTQQVKETVQTASILGREFEVRVLSEMLNANDRFLWCVGQAENANIWVPLTEIEYIFHHALLRDAAYSMQLLSRQRELHRLAVFAMETVYHDDLESHYGELAYHAEKSDLNEKALNYLILAGKLSLSVYQNHQAIDYFTRAMTLVLEDDLRMRFDILIERAEAYYRVSDFDAQSRDLSSLEDLVQRLNIAEFTGRVFAKRAYYFFSLGDYQNAIQYANEAKVCSELAQDNATLLAVYMVMQSALLHIGRTEEAIQNAKNTLTFTRQINDRHGESAACTALGLILQESEGPAIARDYHEQALVIVREINDRYLEAKILNNLANTVGLSLGDFPAAKDYFLQSLSIFQEHGDLSGKGLIMVNLGWLAGMLGDYPAAMDYYEQSLVISRKVGNRMEEMYTYINLCTTEIAQGRADDAFSWIEKAFEFSNALGERSAAGWVYFCWGHAHLLKSNYDAAVEAFLKSIEIRTQINAPILAAETRSGLCEALLRSGDLISAQNEAEHLMGYIEENRTLEGMEEPLRVFLSVINVLDKTKDPRVPVVLQYAIQLLEAQVSKLRSEEARRMFVENVPWRRTIWQLAKTKGLMV
jgi:predicted ATPase/class 3 adenylate cyclase